MNNTVHKNFVNFGKFATNTELLNQHLGDINDGINEQDGSSITAFELDGDIKKSMLSSFDYLPGQVIDLINKQNDKIFSLK